MDELFAIGAKCLLASKGAELQEEDLEMSGFNPKMERLSPKKTGNLLEEAQGSPGVQISFLKGNLARRLLRPSLFAPELCPPPPLHRWIAWLKPPPMLLSSSASLGPGASLAGHSASQAQDLRRRECEPRDIGRRAVQAERRATAKALSMSYKWDHGACCLACLLPLLV